MELAEKLLIAQWDCEHDSLRVEEIELDPTGPDDRTLTYAEIYICNKCGLEVDY